MKLSGDERILRRRSHDNDPTLLRIEICHGISLYDEDQIQGFLDALSPSSSVESVFVTAQVAQRLNGATHLDDGGIDFGPFTVH